MLKLECVNPTCGFIARATAKNLDLGMPVCACGTPLSSPQYAEVLADRWWGPTYFGQPRPDYLVEAEVRSMAEGLAKRRAWSRARGFLPALGSAVATAAKAVVKRTAKPMARKAPAAPAPAPAVTAEVVGSKVRHALTNRRASITVETVPDVEEMPYRGYSNPLGYEGDALAAAEARDRVRHEEYVRDCQAYAAKRRAAQDALVEKFANTKVRKPSVAKPFRVTYTNTLWQAKPFGMGDWVLVGPDKLPGQIWGEPTRNEMCVVVSFPDGRNRPVYAGLGKAGAWEYNGVPLERSTPEVPPTELTFD